MPRFDFQFDKISFWLGFLAASLFWWVLNRIRPFIPLWRAQLKKNLIAIRQRNLQGVEQNLRTQIIRNARKQHLAFPLFSLDEILIPPSLLVPPAEQGSETSASQTIATRVIPYLPDWPELVASLSVPMLSPAQAIQAGRNLVIIGQPGCGKTVALAHLAAQIARRDPALGNYANAFPIYLHTLDIDPSLQEEKNPLQNLITAVAGMGNRVLQPQISRLIQTNLRDELRPVVLLLDGLDELPPARFSDTTAYLKALIEQFPRLQIVTTASPDYVDGLTKAGFMPLSLAAWNAKQRKQLVDKWGQLWTDQILPINENRINETEINPILLDYWLKDETANYLSPLEWTLRVWGAYAGDVSGSDTIGILGAHLSRFLPNPDYVSALVEMAKQMVQSQQISLSFDEMEKILSKVKLSQSTFIETTEDKADGNALDGVSSTNKAEADPSLPSANKIKTEKGHRRKTHRDRMMSQGEEIISALLDAGVLCEHPGHQICFSNPVFLGLLAGIDANSEEAEKVAQAVLQKADWAVYPQVLRFAAACSENPTWIDLFIDDLNAPLFRNLLIAARWLQDAPLSANWRSTMMRTLVTLIQNETLPMGVRARLVAAFYRSKDPSSQKLFRQLLVSKSPIIRRAALLACGATGNPQLINEILPLLADPQPEVRLTACLALTAIPAEPAFNAVVEILLSGDEELRQAAAEALSKQPGEGYEILKEAAGLEDLVTRRAAVYGLLQVPEEWARKMLERLAIEDGQWIVRNAAAQALEILQQPSQEIPKTLPSPSESAWLITFASKLGMGILPGQPALDVLQMVLKSGTIEEQIAVLPYLREHSEKEVVEAVYNLIYSGEDEIREPALYSLWWMAISGVKLPAVEQFGIGIME